MEQFHSVWSLKVLSTFSKCIIECFERGYEFDCEVGNDRIVSSKGAHHTIWIPGIWLPLEIKQDLEKTKCETFFYLEAWNCHACFIKKYKKAARYIHICIFFVC